MKNMEWYGDKVIASVENAKRGGLTAAALIVEGDATLRAPVGKYPAGSGRVGGNLRSSITHRVVSDEEAHVGTNVEYAARIEFGFSGIDSLGRKYNQPAQPYLRPALDNNKSRIEKMIGDVIGKAVKR